MTDTNNSLFSWEELQDNDKHAPKKLISAFKRAGAEIASSWVEGKTKRESGISYRQIVFVFADNQKINLRVKQSGDVYQVRLNNKILPIKNQDDIKASLVEIVHAADANSTKYQRTLARRKIALPKGLSSTVKRKEVVLADRETELDNRIAEAKKELLELQQDKAA